jgi:hypothetical protein
MGVAKGMPRNAWLLNPVARRREFTVVEVLRTEWSSPWRGEEQIVRPGFCPVGTLRFENFTKTRADRKHAIAAVRSATSRVLCNRSTRFQRSPRISPIRIPVRTATWTTERHGSVNSGKSFWTCAGVDRANFTFPFTEFYPDLHLFAANHPECKGAIATDSSSYSS